MRSRGSRNGDSLAGALAAAAAEVEDAHGAAIDVVTVGDHRLDERTNALVAATREALVNAAKFAADAGPIAVYAEMEGDTARVFVRDRGDGFDPGALPSRPPRRARLDHRQDGAARGNGDRAVEPRRRAPRSSSRSEVSRQ